MASDFQRSTFNSVNNGGTGAGETRRVPRRIFQRPIGVLRHGVYVLVRGLQLSEGGVGFASDTQFAVGETIVATIIIPGGHSIITRGEIVAAKASGEAGVGQYGVRFAPLALQLRRFIRIYVTAKTQAEAETEDRI